MNTRSFLKTMAAAAAGFAILPAATTYARKWVAPNPSLGRTLYVINPEWVNARFEIKFLWHATITQTGKVVEEGYPRFNTDDDGAMIMIPKWVKQ